MTYREIVGVEAGDEPVTLAEARLQCNVDVDDTSHDTELQRLIFAARELGEHETSMGFAPRTVEAALDAFPTDEDDFIRLPLAPVVSITSVKYTDADGAEQTTDDPYRFGPVLGELDAWLLAEGTHLRPFEVLGATPRSMDGVAGTSFAVWAPNARRVSIVGDFNHWDGRRHPMRLRRDLAPLGGAQILQDVKDRGLLEKPDALQSYLDGYGNVFAKFPALKAQLGDAKNLRAEMDTATSASSELTDTLTKQGKSAVANYLQYGNENADRAMRGVLSAKDPKKAIDELLTFVGDDAKAVEGARKTFWNIMQKDARSGGRTTGDINGAQPWSPYSLNKFLDDPVNSAVLERLYRANPEHLTNIRAIAKAIQGTEVRNGAKAVNTSGTAQSVNNVLTPETLQSRLYAYKSGKISGTFLLTSIAAVVARRSVGKAQSEAITRMLDEALLNPEAAALLLKENNPANRRALNRWAKGWWGNEASSIVNALSAEDQDAETKTIMEGQ